jgi:hypothetical protein
MTKYYIRATKSIDGWLSCNAKTLRGAKAIASRTYHESINNRMIVGISDGNRIEVVAIKTAYKAWVNI